MQLITTNFTGGEVSPRMTGRVDLERYNSSARKLENCVVLRQGGVTIRPSRDWIGEIKSSAQTARLIPFVYSRTDSYVLEFGHQYMRVWKGGTLVMAGGAPYEIATPWTESQLSAIDFAQGADTLILCHPDVFPQRIRRFADATWLCELAPFKPAALVEVGDRSGTVTMTVSSTAVGAGRTITASGAFFFPSCVGRTISWGPGRATITARASSTQVTATVETAFLSATADPSVWVLEGSPLSDCTPADKEPEGKLTTLTLQYEGWRPEHVGRYVDIHGGLVEIISLDGTNPETVANGLIRRDLTSTGAAPSDSWSIKGAAWNAFDGYPQSCALFQQRLWLGGTRRFPQTMWGSRTGLYFDFLPGIDDDSAVAKSIDSDDINILQYLVATGQLVMLTYGGEFDARGGVEKPITQLNAALTMRSRWGCEAVRPEMAGRDLLFVQRGGRTIRALFRNQVDGIDTRDISVYSEHMLAAGVRAISWEQVPESVLWVATTDGKLLAVTYSDEQQTTAFCSGNAEGAIEWLCTVPEGAVDATYCLTRYTIGGITRRYLERIEWRSPPGQDSRREFTSATAVSSWPGFAHLAGKMVSVLADDVDVGTRAVGADGSLTTPWPAKKVSAGLPYAAKLVLHAPEVGTGTGTSQGQAISVHKTQVRLLDTTGCVINGQALEFRSFDTAATLDTPPPRFTGLKDVSSSGWGTGEADLTIEQRQPYPFSVVAVIRHMTVNAG